MSNNRKHNELVTVQGTNGGETGKAIRWILDPVEYPNIHECHSSHWFPFSQVEQIHPTSLVVSRWILEQKKIYQAILGNEDLGNTKDPLNTSDVERV